MHKSIINLNTIENSLKSKIKKLPTIIAVTKTFPMSEIIPLINHGHIDFGENKVQETLEKWSSIKNDFHQIKLHMIGKLQTNKVKYAVNLFDYIHSLDNLRLAEKIASEQIKQKKQLKIFIQINIGEESQKSGISIDRIENFYEKCTKDLGLQIVGLMCLPPNNEDSKDYFFKMRDLSKKMNIKNLSMGMSNDYLDAAINGSTHLRIGSKIFGKRN
ncbi:YggS family pyridoxal phosphate-dependent enzyme [Candidatus Pelagibacter sp.]|jgi:PLP dependent protein|nr:YggS family pyridoxal phosphate-dependent enzyme [Candidatus Pelagibacter sp.]